MDSEGDDDDGTDVGLARLDIFPFPPAAGRLFLFLLRDDSEDAGFPLCGVVRSRARARLVRTGIEGEVSPCSVVS